MAALIFLLMNAPLNPRKWTLPKSSSSSFSSSSSSWLPSFIGSAGGAGGDLMLPPGRCVCRKPRPSPLIRAPKSRNLIAKDQPPYPKLPLPIWLVLSIDCLIVLTNRRQQPFNNQRDVGPPIKLHIWHQRQLLPNQVLHSKRVSQGSQTHRCIAGPAQQRLTRAMLLRFIKA